MKKILLTITLASLLFTRSVESDSFVFNLYKQVGESEENFVVSPLSLSLALSMAYAGAAGRTAEEMKCVLGYSEATPELTLQRLQQIATDLKSREQIALASSLWFHPDLMMVADFGRAVSQFSGEIFPLFDDAVDLINSWVYLWTQGGIDNLVGSGDITPLTRLVILNAIYLKAPWCLPFDPRQTKDEKFYTKDGASLVPMMQRSLFAQHASLDGVTLVRLPLQGGLDFVILLPEDLNGLPDLEQRLSEKALQRWLAAMEAKSIHLKMPRFDLETRLDALSALAQMGMPRAFSSKADFSKMTYNDVHISTVVQKAFLHVQEEGIEAGAATAVVIGVRSCLEPVREISISVDHPFAFLILDSVSNEPLFIGRLLQP